jgi:hypothetical protein
MSCLLERRGREAREEATRSAGARGPGRQGMARSRRVLEVIDTSDRALERLAAV